MGSAVGSLAKDERIEMTRILREEMDKLIGEHAPDKEINERMKKAFQSYLDHHHADKGQGWETHVTSPSAATNKLMKSPSKLNNKQQEELIIRLQVRSNVRRPSNSSSTSKLDTKAVAKQVSSPSRTQATRRKSFAQIQAPAMTTIKETDVHVETADPQGVDSWDSVTQQPYCSVCLMAFKSLSALERHEKFSELHEKVLKKLKDDYEQQHAEAVDVQQIEGIHYKLLYTGRKLYWRTQESVDFSFYYHFESKTVEIIAFHIESMDEINRLYLDHVILTKIIEQLFTRKTFDSDDLAIIAAQTELEKEESLRLTLTTFILSRLCAVDEAATIYGGSNSITFKLTPSDPTKLYPLLAAHPVNLHPVHVNARRRSSTEEIDHMIMGLAHDTNMVVAATTAAENRSNATTAALSAAEKITSIVTDAASVLVSKGRQNRKLGPRQRWIWAARRVIHNLEVEKVKMRFAARK